LCSGPLVSQFGTREGLRVWRTSHRVVSSPMAAILSPGRETLADVSFHTRGRGPESSAIGKDACANPSSSFVSFRNERSVTPTPGAGSYELHGSLVRTGGGRNTRGYSSMIGKTQRSVRDLQRERQPGPGSYDPFLASTEANARRVATKAKDTHHTHHPGGTRVSDVIARPVITPGPGDYAPRSQRSEVRGGARSAFRSGMDRFGDAQNSQKKSKNKNTPSPAAYANLHSQYNTSFSSGAGHKTGSSVLLASSSLARPVKKEIPGGAMMTMHGVSAPVSIAEGRRNAETKKVAQKNIDRRETQRVTSSAAARISHKPGLPLNAPTPNGYSSFGLRVDSREQNDWYGVSPGNKANYGGDSPSSGKKLKKNAGNQLASAGFRTGGIAPKPCPKPTPPPRMKSVTGEYEIVEFYEIQDRAFEAR
jgi:hypothetical protein